MWSALIRNDTLETNLLESHLVIFQPIIFEFLSDETVPHGLYMDVLYVISIYVEISAVGGSILKLSQIIDIRY